MKQVAASLMEDPHTRGKVEKFAGMALIADGLVGLENPLDGKKSRSGILGGVFLLVIGAAFFLAGNFVADQGKPYENGVEITGKVVQVVRGSGSSSNTCSRVIEYRIAEETYMTGDDHLSSSSYCDDMGQDVKLSYLPNTPGSARVIDNGAKSMGVIFMAMGLGLVGVAVVGTLIKLAEIIIGVVLWVRGRRRVRNNPPTVESDWLARLQSAWSGQDSSAASSGALPAPAPATDGAWHLPPPRPQGPPPGWYQESTSPTGRRWWDGTTWTEHV